MRRIFAPFLLLFGASATSACSFGSFQTAHTQPTGTLSVTPGVARAYTRIDDQNGRDVTTNVGLQIGGRVGITPRLDAGLGSFMRAGVKADLKLNVLDPRRRLALAPRIGAGYRGDRAVRLLEAGAITSYRIADRIEPYLGLTFANHWIDPEPPPGPLPANVLGKRGTGDGLLQLNLGVQLIASEHVAMLFEYGHWFPLNDDPGDFYAFVPTNVFGVAFRFGTLTP